MAARDGAEGPRNAGEQPLPAGAGRFRIHEWSIMNEFAEAQHSKQVRQELLEAIHGAGAFRMFRSTIRRLGIEKSWYRFHEEALAEIARDWLEAHELPYR
jgi:hypothetical protein